MKYNISGYSQNTLLKYDFDCNDAVLLRAIMDMYTSGSEKMEYIIYENEKYIWLTYGYISEQLPLLGSTRTIKRKVDDFVEKKILKRVILNSRNKKAGKYMYLAPGENFNELLTFDFHKQTEDNQVTDCHKAHDKVSLDPVTNCHDKDSSITDYSNKIINKKREDVPHLIKLIMDKYHSLDLPKYVKLPENHVFMDCYNAYGIKELYNALEIMGESSYVMKNFSIDMIFNVKNLRKALNGTYKDKFPVRAKENHVSENLRFTSDKVYTPDFDNDSLFRALGIR